MALLTTCFVKFFSCEILEIQAAKPVLTKETLMLEPEILQLLCCLRLLNHSPKEISIGNLQGNFPNATLCLSKALLRDHGCYFLTNRRFFSGILLGGWYSTLQFLSSDLVPSAWLPKPPPKGLPGRFSSSTLDDFIECAEDRKITQKTLMATNISQKSQKEDHLQPSWQLRYPLTKRNF